MERVCRADRSKSDRLRTSWEARVRGDRGKSLLQSNGGICGLLVNNKGSVDGGGSAVEILQPSSSFDTCII